MFKQNYPIFKMQANYSLQENHSKILSYFCQISVHFHALNDIKLHPMNLMKQKLKILFQNHLLQTVGLISRKFAKQLKTAVS